jgi:hypothetical protein
MVNTREDWAKALADEFQHAPRQTLRSSGCDRVEMHYWGWLSPGRNSNSTPGRNGGIEADGVQHAPAANVTVAKPKQSANASLPMVFTLVGMAIDGRSRFAKKAESPMDSSTPPKVMEIRLRLQVRHLAKAWLPIVFTLAGIVIDSRRREKA